MNGREFTVADQLWLDSLEPEVRALCDRYIESQRDTIDAGAWNDGYAAGVEHERAKALEKKHTAAAVQFIAAVQPSQRQLPLQ